jgi:O-antigen/teichoic acid export membrane protein
MVVIKTSRKDIIWNYLATIFSIGTGVIVLPMLLHFLSSEEVGLNYLLLTITSMGGLLDFGFSPQIGRNVTYALSGAKSIEKEGLNEEPEAEPNFKLLAIVIETARQIYKRMSIVVLVVLLLLGTPYIYHVTHAFQDVENTLVIWLIFCFSTYLNIYFKYYRSLLTGSGKIFESSVSIILSKGAYIIVCCIMLLFGYGLFSVVIANLFTPFILFLYGNHIFYTPDMKRNLAVNISKQDIKDAFSAIWYNAKKLGINQLGTFAILKLNLFLIGLFLPLKVVGSFGVLTQVVQTLSGLASALFQSFVPQFSHLQVTHNYREIVKKLSVTTVFYWVSLVLTGIVVLLLLPILLKMIGSSTNLPSFGICIIYLLIIALEGNHSNFATIIATSNKVPFVTAGLVAGGFIAIFTYLTLRYTEWELWGVVLAQGLVQLSYNNWKWPVYVLKDLNCTPMYFIEIGFAEIRKKLKKNNEYGKLF